MPKQFQYYTPADNPQPHFQGPLSKLQCQHTIQSTGHRCRRYQIIGAGFCWKHLETDRHLKIQTSTVPGGGLGLFAFDGTSDNQHIVFSGPKKTMYGQRPGDFIIEYTGETLPQATMNMRYGKENTAPYGAEINKLFVEDSALLRSAGSLANHKPHSKANARLVSNGRVIRLEATKSILNGAEIFIDYGDSYDIAAEGTDYRHSTRYVRR